VVALGSAFTLGWQLMPPFGELRVIDETRVTALVVFVIVALVAGELSARGSASRREASQRSEELAATTAELDSTLSEQARMAEELTKLAVMEEIDAQRAALLRSVSHDLRTPLATIRGVTSDLRSDTPYDDDTRAELLGLVADEAERLDRLVGNLLSMSRIEAGSFAPDLQAVDLAELLETSIRRLTRVLRDRRVEADLPEDLPLVSVDYSQIDQVVTNLLENAVRHSPPRSTIRVRARRVAEEVEIAVQDAGTGVLPNERTRIFEAFHRSEGSRSSGIGLAICRAVVEAHGGTIKVMDAPGGGARFLFTVPVLADADRWDGTKIRVRRMR